MATRSTGKTRTSKRGVKWAQKHKHGVAYWEPTGVTDKFHMREQAKMDRAGKTRKRRKSKKSKSKKR